MLELLEAQDGVIAMRATGLLDAADIERGIAAVDEALNTHARLAIYAEVDIAGMTPRALLKDIAYGISSWASCAASGEQRSCRISTGSAGSPEPRTRCSRLKSGCSLVRRRKQRCPGFQSERPEWISVYAVARQSRRKMRTSKAL